MRSLVPIMVIAVRIESDPEFQRGASIDCQTRDFSEFKEASMGIWLLTCQQRWSCDLRFYGRPPSYDAPNYRWQFAALYFVDVPPRLVSNVIYASFISESFLLFFRLVFTSSFIIHFISLFHLFLASYFILSIPVFWFVSIGIETFRFLFHS